MKLEMTDSRFFMVFIYTAPLQVALLRGKQALTGLRGLCGLLGIKQAQGPRPWRDKGSVWAHLWATARGI